MGAEDAVSLVRFYDAIEQFVEDLRGQGRMAPKTERQYRDVLMRHAEDSQLRDPRMTTRDDVKRTLKRWTHPNTQANRRSVLISFYDWLMEEGYRRDNPARQTRRPRKRKPVVYRMTIEETLAFLAAARGTRERRLAYLGVCAGLRVQELQRLQGRHFQREGWVWVSEDIGKGGRERWIPVVADLKPIADEIRENVGLDEYVIPREQTYLTGDVRTRKRYPTQPTSPQTIHRVVGAIGERADIAANIHPHLMRHAFADHVARYAGTRVAQHLLGHANLATTQTYLGGSTLDELAAAVEGISFNGDGGSQ